MHNQNFFASLLLSTAISLFLLTPQVSKAHPVSFKKGFGLMSFNSEEMNELMLTYSFTSRFAVATTVLRDSESDFYLPRLNFLVKRWLNPDSQGNIYLSAGQGFEQYESQSDSASLAEVVLDWESRKYYTYFKQTYIRRDLSENPNLTDKNYDHSQLRLGFAPFLADYSDLNVWWIAQFDRHDGERKIEATQFLRFYIRNVLWEIGANINGGAAFNFMIHM